MLQAKWNGKMQYLFSMAIHQNHKRRLWQLSNALEVLYGHSSPLYLLHYILFKDYWHISKMGMEQENDKHISLFLFIYMLARCLDTEVSADYSSLKGILSYCSELYRICEKRCTIITTRMITALPSSKYFWGSWINSKLLIQREITLLLVGFKHWACLPERHGNYILSSSHCFFTKLTWNKLLFNMQRKKFSI